MTAQNEKLLGKLEGLAEKLEKEQKAYGILTIILSVLDVLTGILCIFLTSVQITAVVTSILSGSVVGSRAIQVLKSRNLIKTVALINGLSASYVVSRVKKGEYMKNFLKANKYSILSAIGLGGIVGTSTFFLMPLVWLAPLYAKILIACGVGIVVFLLVFFLGREKFMQYALRIATKHLPNDKIENVLDIANKFNEEMSKLEAEEKEKKELEAKKKQAKKIVEEYENAKKLLEK